jgi:glucose-6-phosphate isomerase
MTIHLDFTCMRAPRIPNGVSDAEWPSLTAAFAAAHATVRARVADDRYGFANIAAQEAEHQRVVAWAASMHGRFDDIVVLGIGGSALGASMLRTALLPYGWNERNAAQRGGQPRWHVVDNVDPRSMAGLFELIECSRTLFLVISKSGGTAETMAQYLFVRHRLDEQGLPASHHIAVVTDPVAGVLRPVAERDGLPCFSVPQNVGGRFSLFTPVATLPAALVGIDTTALRAGAAAMAEECANSTLEANPAGQFALLQWRAHARAGQGIHVLMPYSDAMRGIAPWFVQLWAESLGKQDADGRHTGPTPLAALGASDQHSQVQLFMEGPADKTITLIAERNRAVDLRIPGLPGAPEGTGYLEGRTMGALLDAEQVATAEALAENGRPSMQVVVDRCDAWHIGALAMWLMQATVLAGELYRVNPLNQPGVELGKTLARQALLEAPISNR